MQLEARKENDTHQSKLKGKLKVKSKQGSSHSKSNETFLHETNRD